MVFGLVPTILRVEFQVSRNGICNCILQMHSLVMHEEAAVEVEIVHDLAFIFVRLGVDFFDLFGQCWAGEPLSAEDNVVVCPKGALGSRR